MEFPILSTLILVPLIAGIAVLFMNANAARWTALLTTLVCFALGIVLWANYQVGGPRWQFTEYLGTGQGGFVPGIRPGIQTERFLAKTLNRITLPGALFIAALALLPAILVGFIVDDNASQIGYNFGGISMLIAVGVALETMKQIDGQLMMRNYESFLDAK